VLEHFASIPVNSNAFTAWKDLGSPQAPTADQCKKLKSVGQLQLLTSAAWVHIEHGTTQLQVQLPRQGLSLVSIEWLEILTKVNGKSRLLRVNRGFRGRGATKKALRAQILIDVRPMNTVATA
jgi:hypothetical protein